MTEVVTESGKLVHWDEGVDTIPQALTDGVKVVHEDEVWGDLAAGEAAENIETETVMKGEGIMMSTVHYQIEDEGERSVAEAAAWCCPPEDWCSQ